MQTNHRYRSPNINPSIANLNDIELKILTYYGKKEDIYGALTQMSKKSIQYMKSNYKKIEREPKCRHANENIKLTPIKSIEEHNSGINQMILLNQVELVTVSDDCTLKFWSSKPLTVEAQIVTETITCIAATGAYKKDILVAGCHSGNFILIRSSARTKKQKIESAHQNLIRVIVSLETLNNKFFASGDVCGIIKVWTSTSKPLQLIEIQQEGALCYNSIVEVAGMLPKKHQYQDATIIACALKSQKVNLILIKPQDRTYQYIKTLRTELKPTCLIQLSSKHLAVAVGSLKEASAIEIHDMNKNKIVSSLKHHSDMIDSLLKLKLSPFESNTSNPYVQWLLSASRDRTIVLWKLIDGKIMKRSQQALESSMLICQPMPLNLQNKKKRFRQVLSSHSSVQHEDQEDQPNNGNIQNKSQEHQQVKTFNETLIDYYYTIETTHKDFIRSMVQLDENTLLTASEDKTIKVFTITC